MEETYEVRGVTLALHQNRIARATTQQSRKSGTDITDINGWHINTKNHLLILLICDRLNEVINFVNVTSDHLLFFSLNKNQTCVDNRFVYFVREPSNDVFSTGSVRYDAAEATTFKAFEQNSQKATD